MESNEIGKRAATEIAAYLAANNIQYLRPYLKTLKINPKMFYQWWNMICNPSAKHLRLLALAGYDVFYILTGKRQKSAAPSAATPEAAGNNRSVTGSDPSNHNT